MSLSNQQDQEASQTFAGLSLTVLNGEPRVRDVDVGVALGFTRPTKVRELVARYEEKLKEFGVLPTIRKTLPGGGRPADEYFLNRPQALFLCAKSETTLAFEVTAQMVRLFDEALDGPKSGIVRAPQDLEEALVLALAQQRELKAKSAQLAAAEAKIEVLTPAAAVAEAIANADGLHTLSEAGKMLDFGLVTFCARLRKERILMEDNQPYETHRQAGRFEVKERTYWNAKHKENRLSATTYVTGKGLVWLAQRLGVTLPLQTRLAVRHPC
jgi:phage antirepressor YoqD-like protein